MEARRHAGRQRDAHAVRAVVGRCLLGQQDRHHRAQHIGRGGLVAHQRGPEARGREALFHHQRGAGQQRLEEGVHRVGVEQRQRGQQHLAVAQRQQRGGVAAPPVELRVRAAHALGQARRARGVEDGQRVAGLHRRGLGERIAGCGEALGAGLFRRIDAPHALQRQAGPVLEPAQRGQSLGLGDEQPRAGVGEDVPQRGAPRGGVDGHRHGTDPGAAQEGLQELGAVAAHQRHAVAGADAGGLQHRAHGPGRVQRVGIAPAGVAGDEQRALGEAAALALQHRRQRAPGGREGLDGIGHGGPHMKSCMFPKAASQFTRSTRLRRMRSAPSACRTSSCVAQPAYSACSSWRVSV